MRFVRTPHYRLMSSIARLPYKSIQSAACSINLYPQLKLVSNPIHSGTPPIPVTETPMFCQLSPQVLFVRPSWLNRIEPIFSWWRPLFWTAKPQWFPWKIRRCWKQDYAQFLKERSAGEDVPWCMAGREGLINLWDSPMVWMVCLLNLLNSWIWSI